MARPASRIPRHCHADGDAGFTGDHQVVVFGNVQDGDQRPGLFGNADGFHALTPAVGDPGIPRSRCVCRTLFGYNKYGPGFIFLNQHKSYQPLHRSHYPPRYLLYADGAAAGVAHGIFRETDGAAAADGHHDLAVTIGDGLASSSWSPSFMVIAFTPVLTRTAELFQQVSFLMIPLRVHNTI